MKRLDMTGNVFGRLTVMGYAEIKNARVYWLCQCSCGNRTTVSGSHLRAGRIISCGCARGGKKIYADYSIRRKELLRISPGKPAEYTRRYREKNREKSRASARSSSSVMRAKKANLHSRPAWFQKEKIMYVYKKAREFGFDVDHVVPLVSPLVCGLHVWENLQLMDSTCNKQKGNKEWPDMP